MSPLKRRLAEVEQAIAGIARGTEIMTKPVHEVTDAEAVQAVHDLCHARPPGMRGEDPRPDPETQAIVAQMRRLICERYG